jgi:hypothetical protein
MNKLTAVYALVACMCACLLSCTSDLAPDRTGGGGSETVNARVIAVANSLSIDVHATVPKHIAIGVFSAGFNPYADTGFSRSQKTYDSAALLTLDSVASGRYQVMVSDSLSGKAVLFRDIVIPAPGPDTTGDSLYATASVSGTVTAAVKPLPNSLVALIPGTPRWAMVDSTNRFTLRGIPAGATTIRISAIAKYRAGNDTSVTLTLSPGMVVDSLVIPIGN